MEEVSAVAPIFVSPKHSESHTSNYVAHLQEKGIEFKLIKYCEIQQNILGGKIEEVCQYKNIGI